MTITSTMIVHFRRNHRYVAIFCILLPCIASNTAVASTFATIYLGVIGFFTGLLAVSTAAQLLTTHIISRFNDTMSQLPVLSKRDRILFYFVQIFLTLVIAAIVIVAPYTDVSRVITGDPGMEVKWPLAARIVATLVWTVFNSLVLLDTIVYSFVSIYLLLRGSEKGGALLVLLAAAGSSDFVSFKRIRNSLAIAFHLDCDTGKQAVIVSPVAIGFNPGDRAYSTVARIEHECNALRRATEIEREITTSLMQVGTSMSFKMKISAMHCSYNLIFRELCHSYFHRMDMFDSPDRAHIRSRLTKHAWLHYCAYINSQRESHWNLTLEMAQVSQSSLLCDFRVVALDLLHSYHRMATWQYIESIERNKTLHWARSRFLGEWLVLFPLRPGFFVELNDLHSDLDENGDSWWVTSESLWATLSQIDVVPAKEKTEEVVSFGDEINNCFEGKFGVDKTATHGDHVEDSWKQQQANGFDSYNHGSDWFHVRFRGSEQMSENWKICAGQNHNLKDLLETKGNDLRISGMSASSWFSLLIMDLVMCYMHLEEKEIVIDEKKDRAVMLIGGFLFGMVRVAATRSSIKEIYLEGPQISPPSLALSCFFFSLGTEIIKHWKRLERERPQVVRWLERNKAFYKCSEIHSDSEDFPESLLRRIPMMLRVLWKEDEQVPV